MSKERILVVEDELDIRELIHFNLFKCDYQVVTAEDGEAAWDILEEQAFDLILLDLMMPKLDGVHLCGMIKSSEQHRETPVIMVTARGAEEDIVKGLEAGADDYVTKPFSPKVLLARVQAVLRRSKKGDIKNSDEYEIGNIKIDNNRRSVNLDGKELNLTYSEFQLLYLLATKPGWVFTRSQIVDAIRGENHAITDRAVDVQVVGLRRKLKDSGNLIETVRGVGYRFKELR